jgi:hexokinase
MKFQKKDKNEIQKRLLPWRNRFFVETTMKAHNIFSSSFRFEKYISGKYLGEVVRVVLKSLVDKGLLFTKASKELFPAPWKFGTDNVSHIEE